MPLYFAYGANMNREAMARRCPRSKALGLARLASHRLAVMREGYLTAIRDPRGTVHGALWDLALTDVPALDRYEGLPQGLYAKAAKPVMGPSGPRRALVYFGANVGPGTARLDYLAEIIAAARAWSLPEDAIAALEAIQRSAAARGAASLSPIRPAATRL
ncbi:MAG: gamma-glutamylcyclotransferase [Hyphomicrobiales bacterium]|nr:gamma-glutamylcyclotransferase [Hyphomicrobiales bacterium]